MKKLFLIFLLLSYVVHSQNKSSIRIKKQELQRLRKELKSVIEEKEIDTEILKLKLEKEKYEKGLTEQARKEYDEKELSKLMMGSHHNIFIGLPIKYLSLTSTELNDQSQAIIGTAPIVGLSINLEQVWSQKWKTFIETEFDYVQYKGDASHLLQNDKELLPTFFVGASMKFRTKWEAFAKIGASKQTYVRSQSGEIILDHNFIQKGKVGIKREIISNKKSKLAGELSGSFLMPLESSYYSLSGGIGFEGKLILEHKLRSKILHIELVYSSESQSSDITEQSTSGFGITAGFCFPF